MKFQVNMDDELFNKLEEYADSHFITRSGAVAIACNQLIMTDELSKAICSMAVSMHRIAENNVVDEQAKSELRSFMALAELFANTPVKVNSTVNATK